MHPFGVPIVVVTHSVPDGWPKADLPVQFVTDGAHAAGRAWIAGNGLVGVAAARPPECPRGVLDKVEIDLMPV